MPPSVATMTITEHFCTRNKGTPSERCEFRPFLDGCCTNNTRRDRGFPRKLFVLKRLFRLVPFAPFSSRVPAQAAACCQLRPPRPRLRRIESRRADSRRKRAAMRSAMEWCHLTEGIVAYCVMQTRSRRAKHCRAVRSVPDYHRDNGFRARHTTSQKPIFSGVEMLFAILRTSCSTRPASFTNRIATRFTRFGTRIEPRELERPDKIVKRARRNCCRPRQAVTETHYE